MKKRKFAYNLAEFMITMGVVAVIISMTLSVAKKFSPDMNKGRFKKAYTVIEKTTAKLINDEDLYPDDMGFRNTTARQTEFGETFGMPNAESKFRDAFKYSLNVVEDNINCPIWGMAEGAVCFKTDDGIVYGIPNTDFATTNLQDVTIQRTNDQVIRKYLPIAIYTNWERQKIRPNLQNDAFFVGVLYNGNVRLLTTHACAPEHSAQMQCKAQEYLEAESIRGER